MTRLNPLFGALALLLSAASAFAQRDLKDIPDPDPEIERKSFIVADGFEVNLFAADPQIAKPIQMNFDPQGRLWIASSEVYPHIAPGQVANDRVLVVEDVDGDGKADKTTVFADGLLIPTGVEPGDGGAYVANSTELVHFRDTDGDGKADDSTIVLSGFGTEDTHHIIHTFRWGPEALLYFNQSIYIHSHIETPHGVRRLNGGGIWQFRPESQRLEVVARGFVNTWGHHHDAWGQQFATDGAYGEGINYTFPGAAFVTAVAVPKLLKGLNPGSPKHCGLELVSGRHLPDDWQGNAITNDFRGHRVCRFVLSEDGSGYASREQPEVIKTNHVAFRPIDVKMGPDGAIYIADWYNPIIQHGEVDFRDPRRDHVHGRIWRVSAKNRPLVPRPQLVAAETPALLESLKAPEEWTRRQAKRVLKERGRDVLPAVAEWLKKLDPADAGFEHHRLEALWIYQAHDVVEPVLLAQVLHSPEPKARAAAVRVLTAWLPRVPDAPALLAEASVDEHPRVRLEAIRGLGQVKTIPAVEAALATLSRPTDRFLEYALWLTVRELQPVWLPELQAGRLNFGGDARQLAFALEAAGVPGVVKPLLDTLNTDLPPERQSAILALAGAIGGPDELAIVWELARTKRSAAVLQVLENSARQRRVKPAGDLANIVPLLADESPEVQSAAARLAGAWQIEGAREGLEKLAKGDGVSAPVRTAAFDGLAALGGPASQAVFVEVAGAVQRPMPERLQAAAALTSLDLLAATKVGVTLLTELKASDDPAVLLEAFVNQKGGASALAAALADIPLSTDAAKLAVRAVRNTARNEQELIDALSRAGNLTTGVQILSSEQMTALVAEVKDKGNPARGEEIFRRQDLGCFKCHAIGGTGGQVGPDLVSIGASAQVDYLIDSLLQPNKQVKENYHSVVVVDDAGKIHTGIKVSQSDKTLVLRTVEDKEITIPLDAIDEQAPGQSIMPVGLTDTLTRPELVDLVRFLSELGKVGPYAIGRSRVVRRWETLQPTPASAANITLDTLDVVAQSPGNFAWQPRYSRVSGLLPLAEAPSVKVGDRQARFVSCELEVSTPGAVRVRASRNPDVAEMLPATLWIDGRRTPPAFDLATGRHRLTLMVFADPFAALLDRDRDTLHLELLDVPGSPAQVQIIGGK